MFAAVPSLLFSSLHLPFKQFGLFSVSALFFCFKSIRVLLFFCTFTITFTITVTLNQGILSKSLEAFKLLLLSFTLARYLDLLLALTGLGARPSVASLGAPVSTLHQFGTLVLAAKQRVLVLLGAGQILSTLDENVGQAAVTLHLDVDDTLRTLARVTSPDGAGVRATLGPGLRAFQLTLLTIGPRLDRILHASDPVTVSGAGAVLTRQLSAAFSAAGGWLG